MPTLQIHFLLLESFMRMEISFVESGKQTELMAMVYSCILMAANMQEIGSMTKGKDMVYLKLLMAHGMRYVIGDQRTKYFLHTIFREIGKRVERKDREYYIYQMGIPTPLCGKEAMLCQVFTHLIQTLFGQILTCKTVLIQINHLYIKFI